jgi:hypothetical protein
MLGKAILAASASFCGIRTFGLTNSNTRKAVRSNSFLLSLSHVLQNTEAHPCPVNLDFYDSGHVRTRGTTRPYQDDDGTLADLGVDLLSQAPIVEDSHARRKRKVALLAEDDRFKPGKFLMVHAGDRCPWWLCEVLQRPRYSVVAGERKKLPQALVQWWHPRGGARPELYNERSEFEPAKRPRTAELWTDTLDLRSFQSVIEVHRHPVTGAVKVPAKFLSR